MPVMQVPGLIHLVLVEHRHLIQVLLVDFPGQVKLLWLDRLQTDHDQRFLELTNNGLHGLDVGRRDPQPPRAVGLVDGAIGEEGSHETACCRASSCAAKASTTSSSAFSAGTL